MLGLEDIVRERNHTSSLRCISMTGQLIMVPAKLFLKRLKNDNTIYKSVLMLSNERDHSTIRKIQDSMKAINQLTLNSNKLAVPS